MEHRVTHFITMPWPPSVNRYWTRARWGGMMLTSVAREYKEKVKLRSGTFEKIKGDASVELALYPPDKRRRDIDNTQKALLDALSTMGVYGDDVQVKRLLVIMHAPCKDNPRAEAFVSSWQHEGDMPTKEEILVSKIDALIRGMKAEVDALDPFG